MHLNVFVCTLFADSKPVKVQTRPNRTGISMVWFFVGLVWFGWDQKPKPNRSVWFETRIISRRNRDESSFDRQIEFYRDEFRDRSNDKFQNRRSKKCFVYDKFNY
jgi:hypothetical protein